MQWIRLRLDCGLRLALVCAAVATAVPARGDDAGDAEALVRKRYYEGLPYALARGLGPEASARLAEMLADASAVSAHGNVVMALGIAGQPGAYEALFAYAAAAPAGELEPDAYNARASVRIAMGHLAASDDRALAWLELAAQRTAPPPWSYRSLSGDRLAAKLQGDALSGLAISGRAEALDALQAAAARAARQGAAAPPEQIELARRAADALELHERIAREGRERVLRTPAQRRQTR